MRRPLFPPYLTFQRTYSKIPILHYSHHHHHHHQMTTELKRAAKRFAPLDLNIHNSAKAPLLRGIVFDVDGTLWCVCLSFFFFFPFLGDLSSFLLGVEGVEDLMQFVLWE